MTTTFKTALENVKSQQTTLEQQDERAVELFVVIPLLKQLGWDTSNPREIYPQHGLSDGGKVDYDLQIDGESRILIEVKRWAHILNHEDETQLENYCQSAKPRPKLAILTSGRDWRLYLAPTANKGKNSVLKIFDEIDITDAQPSEVENTFTQFLARDSIVGFKPTLKEANALCRKLQSYQEQKKLLTEAWNELSKDNNKLAKLVLELAEINDITTNRDNITRFLESFDKPLVNKISTTSKPKSKKKPHSFAFLASPDGTKKMNHDLNKGYKSWRGLLVKICELMQERHPDEFRETILQMPNRFSPNENSKYKISVRDTGIYARSGNAIDFMDSCYDVVTKFDYPKDSLVIKDSEGEIL